MATFGYGKAYHNIRTFVLFVLRVTIFSSQGRPSLPPSLRKRLAASLRGLHPRIDPGRAVDIASVQGLDDYAAPSRNNSV